MNEAEMKEFVEQAEKTWQDTLKDLQEIKDDGKYALTEFSHVFVEDGTDLKWWVFANKWIEMYDLTLRANRTLVKIELEKDRAIMRLEPEPNNTKKSIIHP